jgi:hypothetical protein
MMRARTRTWPASAGTTPPRTWTPYDTGKPVQQSDLLNEPTYMFAGDRHGRAEQGLRALAGALTEARGPGWSALLAVYDAAEAAAAETERYLRDAG